jgi:hypothetical protein
MNFCHSLEIKTPLSAKRVCNLFSNHTYPGFLTSSKNIEYMKRNVERKKEHRNLVREDFAKDNKCEDNDKFWKEMLLSSSASERIL